ncbi:hypothetical protein QMZ05_11390 [Bradyrhizobium sp. INPA03-11B]|uniref:hypothetical protein n=1 Tax=Bradyrhizobium sp. INPA03-11B TaxID=418598 RepID=UPI00338E0B82
MAIDTSADKPASVGSKRAVNARYNVSSPRYPENGAWPAEMRVDMLAAYLDFRSVRELVLAVSRGDAPSPTSSRGTGRSREAIWARTIVDEHVAGARAVRQNRPTHDLAALV